ncbi:MAG: 50S ribosomal protein P1 [Candidatus Aenigmarchaeota archaeon]|nr:50S ribosomal protein P1 [Candidatus Aenigmarchaeota archaeon]
MQEVYAALMLHDAKQPINEDNLKKVLSSVGASVEDTKIKALVASLEGVDIDQALTQAAVVAVAAPAAGGAAEKAAAPAEDEGKKAEEAAAGLSALFG